MMMVIAIIGILSSVVIAGTSSLRATGRDNRRIADVQNMQLAFEQYKQACGRYPGNASGPLEGDLAGKNPSDYDAGCAPGSGTSLASFLSSFPVYPAVAIGAPFPTAYASVAPPAPDYHIGMNAVGQSYIIQAKLETSHRALNDTSEYDGTFTSASGPVECNDSDLYYCVGY